MRMRERIEASGASALKVWLADQQESSSTRLWSACKSEANVIKLFTAVSYDFF
jgi:hypothetical protein